MNIELNFLDNSTLWVAISFIIFVVLVFRPLKNLKMSLDQLNGPRQSYNKTFSPNGIIDIYRKTANRETKKFVLGGISYKSKAKKRSSFLKKIKFYNSPLKLVKDNNIDLIIELIGGDSGIAKELAFSSLTYKKPFITANKALIAKHGIELSNVSKKNNTFIGFEAAIAGGIPIVKVIKESLISNKIEQITGILNGTSNYLLDEIEKKSLNFETVLKKAQE